MDDKKITLCIVDDHEVVRAGLKALLSGANDIDIIGEAGNVTEGVLTCSTLNPDVLLLDVQMPDGSGFDLCRQISHLDLKTSIIILTSFADDEAVFQAIENDVDGFILKDTDREGLLKSIRTVASGQSILDPAVTKRVMTQVRKNSEPVEKTQFDTLAPQERRVLALVAEGKTNKEIAADLKLSDKTVKNYLSNVFEKLSISRRSQAAAFYVQNVPK